MSFVCFYCVAFRASKQLLLSCRIWIFKNRDLAGCVIFKEADEEQSADRTSGPRSTHVSRGLEQARVNLRQLARL